MTLRLSVAPPGPDDNARVTRLEEAVGFIDHASGQLGREVAAVNREVALLSRRLELLERRLLDVANGVGEAPPMTPPPHSAGPDISREPL